MKLCLILCLGFAMCGCAFGRGADRSTTYDVSGYGTLGASSYGPGTGPGGLPAPGPMIERTFPVGEPHVGVMDSVSFRMSDAPVEWLIAMGMPAALAPLSFAEQRQLLGFSAFYLRVVDDPEGTRFARATGTGAGLTQLRQPGLKVVARHGLEREAECFTLMVCLRKLDALAAAHPDHPTIVFIEPFVPQAPAMAQRWRGPIPGFSSKWVPRTTQPGAPDLAVIAREAAFVLPPARRAPSLGDGANGKLVLLAVTASAAPAGAPFLTAGGAGSHLQILPGRSVPDWALGEARQTAQILAVIDADWDGDDTPSAISAMEAASQGADVIMLSHAAGR